MKAFLLTLSLLCISVPVMAFDVYVIANKTIQSYMSNLSYSEIETIFTLKSKYIPGTATPIKVFVMEKDSNQTKKFVRKYLNMSPERYFDLIESRESSGRGDIAAIMDSESQMAVSVVNKSNTIGYVSPNMAFVVEDKVIIIK